VANHDSSTPPYSYPAPCVVSLQRNVINDFSSRIYSTETEHETMKQELGLRTKALATTEQQRDDALAKAATTATNSQRQRKVLKALREANASMDDKINAAKTSLCKEKEHHGATKDALQLAEWKIAVLTGSLAEASKESDSKSGQLEKAVTENTVLTQRCAVLEGKLAAADDKVAARNAELTNEKQRNSIVAESLAEATKLGTIAKTELNDEKQRSGTVAESLAVCNAELAAANEELARKDAMIASQNYTIAQMLLVAMDQGEENATLRLDLEEAITQMKVSETVTG